MNEKIENPKVARRIESELIRLSRQPGRNNVNLVIWPETAWPYILHPGYRLPFIGRPLVTGINYSVGKKQYNALAYANAYGRITDLHIKFKLTPFGEYRPFGRLVPTPGYLDRGFGPRTITNFVPAVCHEIIASGAAMPKGARPELIINITNDSWFENTSGPIQYIDMVRRQAIEMGVPVARSAYGGISAIIDANGRVLRRTKLGERTIIDGNIPAARDGITIYRRLDVSGIMLIILMLTGSILWIFRKK